MQLSAPHCWRCLSAECAAAMLIISCVSFVAGVWQVVYACRCRVLRQDLQSASLHGALNGSLLTCYLASAFCSASSAAQAERRATGYLTGCLLRQMCPTGWVSRAAAVRKWGRKH